MLPLYQTGDQTLDLWQTKWRAELNPVLQNQILQGLELQGVNLINGAVTFSHKLGRKQQGWFLTDINGAATVYRSKPLNDLTLTLTSNAAVTVSLWVY